MHFFVFEYLQDDLVIVLTNSISDMESIDMSTHGFNRDGLPDTQDVRVDLVGGFAIQKVTDDRSYFRTIVNMDIKLDFVPPAFINFISRQLIGSGFRLYQKEVASVVKGDKDFGKALKEPLYTQIHEALYSDNIVKEVLEPEAVKSDIYVLPAEQTIETMHSEGGNLNDKLLPNGHATDFEPEAAVIINKKAPGEIEEIEEEEIQTVSLEQDSKESYKSSTNQIVEKFCDNDKKKVVISSEVNQALGILEKVISVFREYGFHPETKSLPGFTDGKFLNLEEDAKELKSAEDNQIFSNGGDCAERNSHEARNSSSSHGSRLKTSNSYAREAIHNRIAPEEDIHNPIEAHQTALCSSKDQTTEAAALEKTTNGDGQVTSEANDISASVLTKRKSKKMRFCCLHFLSGRQMV